MPQDFPYQNNKQVATWLLICAFVIFGMIVLGGVTRLTGSGLSMVEWEPLMGVIPPVTDEQWQEKFEKYQQFPEYQKVNKGMDVAGFKKIFIYEYAHRVLGRSIGVLFFFPFVFFLWRKKIAKPVIPRLWGLFVLGGLQGLLGWYMVKSGLVDVPRVSQYRLTAHLGLAVVIYAFMLWVAFDLLFSNRTISNSDKTKSLTGSWSITLSVLIFLMILSGGLVAGLDAGFAYNTFPLMDGQFFPTGLYNLTPLWLSAFEDITTVQFNHRMFAYLITALVIAFVGIAIKSGLSNREKVAVALLVAALVGQVTLGITTLLMVIPVSLAAAHQGGAIVLLSAALYTAFVFNRKWKGAGQ